jgi:8-oxo-dGTP pyrophosphatase MutT (NUDIX family)
MPQAGPGCAACPSPPGILVVKGPDRVRSDQTNGSDRPIRAAGGLLWRRTARGLRLAIVHRSRYGDWALPKGKLKRGESWLGAAVREVQEETGCEPRVLGFAGAVAYDTERGPKIVSLWNMEALSGSQSALDADEIASVAWVSPAKAIRQLTYPLERLMVETWHKQIDLSFATG